MKTPALLLLAALSAASFATSAQTVTPPTDTAPSAAVPAPTVAKSRKSAAPAAQPATPPAADLTTLVPRDSARKPHDELRRDDRYNGQGVNCSLYPSRC